MNTNTEYEYPMSGQKASPNSWYGISTDRCNWDFKLIPFKSKIVFYWRTTVGGSNWFFNIKLFDVIILTL